VAVVAVLLAACGFHPTAVGDVVNGDDGGGDDGNGSGGSGSGTLMTTFGERPGAEHMGVTTDTFIESSNVTATHGGEAAIWADATPTLNVLLRFDVSALPATVTVTAVELDIVTTSDSLESGTLDFYEALEPWDPAVATWLVRAGTTAWTDSGASPPGSRGALLLGSVFPNVDNTPYTLPIDTATVQRWVALPGSNNGLVAISTSPTGAGVMFSSSREPNTALRPLLRVRYR
jgi:hypothetical protein